MAKKLLKEANNRSYVLKEKDKELLRMADKASHLEALMTNVRYYASQDEEKDAAEAIIKSKIKVFTMEDLLYKYEYYGPEYSDTDNVFCFNKPLPMEVFTLFRFDSAKFEFKDFIILGEDADAGYRKFK